jgi:hypothetical protein
MKDKKKKIPAVDFDAKFERGEDVTEHLNLSQAVKRVNVDFPAWSISELDREADRLGIARQALIKIWVIERLDQLGKKAKGNKVAG